MPSAKRQLEVAAAVIRQNGLVLLSTRPVGKPPYGWEFPGGKIEPGETPQQALKREIMEELGAECTPADPIYELTHETDNAVIHLIFIRTFCTPDTVFSGREGQTFHWFPLNAPPPEELLAPDVPVWNFLTNFIIHTQ